MLSVGKFVVYERRQYPTWIPKRIYMISDRKILSMITCKCLITFSLEKFSCNIFFSLFISAAFFLSQNTHHTHAHLLFPLQLEEKSGCQWQVCVYCVIINTKRYTRGLNHNLPTKPKFSGINFSLHFIDIVYFSLSLSRFLSTIISRITWCPVSTAHNWIGPKIIQYID